MQLGPEISIVIPTYNEKENIALIVQKLKKVLDLFLIVGYSNNMN